MDALTAAFGSLSLADDVYDGLQEQLAEDMMNSPFEYLQEIMIPQAPREPEHLPESDPEPEPEP